MTESELRTKWRERGFKIRINRCSWNISINARNYKSRHSFSVEYDEDMDDWSQIDRELSVLAETPNAV